MEFLLVNLLKGVIIGVVGMCVLVAGGFICYMVIAVTVVLGEYCMAQLMKFARTHLEN